MDSQHGSATAFAHPRALRPPFDPRIGSGPALDPTQCIEPGTGRHLSLAICLAVVFAVVLVATIYGVLIAAIGWIGTYLHARRARALTRGSCLRVSEQQFPEVHACAAAFAQRLSMEQQPEIYVVDSAEVNAFAARLSGRNAIVLTDEIVHAGLAEGARDALSFVIAHELGHIALGHHRWWRSPLRRYQELSRLDEYSADNIACELVGTREAAETGLLMLISGPKLLALTNRAAALQQASEVVADKASKRAERTLTHPLSMRRLDRVAGRFDSASTLRRAA